LFRSRANLGWTLALVVLVLRPLLLVIYLFADFWLLCPQPLRPIGNVAIKEIDRIEVINKPFAYGLIAAGGNI